MTHKKLYMNTSTISHICNHDCVGTCYKNTCPRGSWAKPVFPIAPLPQVGNDTECPMMQFPVSQDDSQKNMIITIQNTWDICRACKYSAKTADAISLEPAFEEHCMDCPVCQIREALEEQRAEADCS